MTTLQGMDADQAAAFANQWLPSWTGNNPDKLAAYYSPDATYLDPAVPNGIHGRDSIRDYFTVLLAKNPHWVWTHTGSMPLQDGFVNLWHATIPIGTQTIECDGLCTVQIRDQLIYRNQVYFDRTQLLTALANSKHP